MSDTAQRIWDASAALALLAAEITSSLDAGQLGYPRFTELVTGIGALTADLLALAALPPSWATEPRTNDMDG